MPKITVVTPTIRIDGLKPIQESLKTQTFTDYEWAVEIGLGKHDLNAAFNRMIKRAKGELIVFAEDFMKFPPDYLQKFWDAYQSDKNVFWTAPLGKTLDWKEIKWDWRGYSDAVDTTYNCWEIDSGAAPKKALYDVGGFDEELDKRWSADNVSVGARAAHFGYKFKNLFTNPAMVYDHDAVEPHPFRDKFDPAFTNERLEYYKFNQKLPYLD